MDFPCKDGKVGANPLHVERENCIGNLRADHENTILFVPNAPATSAWATGGAVKP
jgi:hypothetical protein